MSFFKKRGIAWLLAVIMVTTATTTSVDAKFGRKVEDVIAGFYDGVYADGYQQRGIGSHLSNICAYADSIGIIADNYGLNTEELDYSTDSLKLAMTYSREDISYIYRCYVDLLKELDVLVYQLRQAELNERDSSSLEQYVSSLDGAKSAIESSAYNASVREFLRKYDHFPADFMAELAEVQMPEYFGYA